MMCTGDYWATAVAVARGIGMVAQDTQMVLIQSKSEIHALPANAKPPVSALKQQTNTPHRHRSVSFRFKEAASEEQVTDLFEQRIAEQRLTEQSCKELRFSCCNGDVYQGSGGLSALASIAQVNQLDQEKLFVTLVTSVTFVSFCNKRAGYVRFSLFAGECLRVMEACQPSNV